MQHKYFSNLRCCRKSSRRWSKEKQGEDQLTHPKRASNEEMDVILLPFFSWNPKFRAWKIKEYNYAPSSLSQWPTISRHFMGLRSGIQTVLFFQGIFQVTVRLSRFRNSSLFRSFSYCWNCFFLFLIQLLLKTIDILLIDGMAKGLASVSWGGWRDE